MTRKSLITFGLANAFVILLFWSVWLLGQWLPILNKLGNDLGVFQFAIWLIAFFLASFLSLKNTIRKWAVIKCLGYAVVFSFFLLGLIVVSCMVLAPLFDPFY